MKTIDRYIIVQFLQNFVILSVVMMGLYVLVDLIVDLDEFLDAGKELAGDRGGVVPATLWVLADFYFPFLLLVYVAMSGLIVVAAMGFTIAQMQRHRELIAIMAGGVSLYRVAAPILVAGFLFNLVSLPVQEALIPPRAEKIVRPKSQAGKPTLDEKPLHYVLDESGALVSAASFSPERGEMTHVRIIVLDPETGRQVSLIRCDLARWNEAAERWDLWAFADEQTPGAVYDASSERWLYPGAVRYDPTSNAVDPEALSGSVQTSYATTLSPKVLIIHEASLYLRLQSLRQLEEMHDNPALSEQTRGQIVQIIWSRFSTVLLGVLLLLMGLPYFLARVPGNLLVNAAKACGVTVGAWGGGLVMLQVGNLNPVTAAWLPVIIYLPVSFWMVTKIKT